MPRRLKARVPPADEWVPPKRPATEATPAGSAGGRRRRLVKSGDDPLKSNPCVTQFVGYPAGEFTALIRLRGARTCNLQPTAFSWRPWNLGGFLTAGEAARVMRGASVKVTGMVFKDTRALCFGCCVDCDRRAAVATGYEHPTPIFEGGVEQFTCFECGETIEGEVV